MEIVAGADVAQGPDKAAVPAASRRWAATLYVAIELSRSSRLAAVLRLGGVCFSRDRDIAGKRKRTITHHEGKRTNNRVVPNQHVGARSQR